MYISQTSCQARLTRESPLLWAFVVLRAKNAVRRVRLRQIIAVSHQVRHFFDQQNLQNLD